MTAIKAHHGVSIGDDVFDGGLLSTAGSAIFRDVLCSFSFAGIAV